MKTATPSMTTIEMSNKALTIVEQNELSAKEISEQLVKLPNGRFLRKLFDAAWERGFNTGHDAGYESAETNIFDLDNPSERASWQRASGEDLRESARAYVEKRVHGICRERGCTNPVAYGPHTV